MALQRSGIVPEVPGRTGQRGACHSGARFSVAATPISPLKASPMDTPIIDCHTHTRFSDGRSTFEENVRAAAAAGCRVLVPTDHLTLPQSMDATGAIQVVADDLPAHRAAFEEARALAAKLAPALEFVYGFECDWYPGCEPLVERWSAGAVFRLGSVHWIGDPGAVEDPDAAPALDPEHGVGWIDDSHDRRLWEALGPDEIWRRYIAAWCEACASPLPFSSMAHPDLPMRFAGDGVLPSIDLAPLWDEMAACAHDTGRHVEVSTAGLRKGVGSHYPAASLLERFERAEVPITVASDAHRAEDICWGIRGAYEFAYACGYRAVDAPRSDGSWQTFSLA